MERTCARCGKRFETHPLAYVCAACRDLPLVHRDPCELTPREMQICALLAQSKPNKIIAYELCLTDGTVKVFIRRIFQKLGVSNRTQLALWYVGNNIPNRPVRFLKGA